MDDSQGFLAAQHRALVDEFIDAVINEVPTDMGIEGRNALGLAVRNHAENELIPGVIAAFALLLGVSHGALQKDLPQWIEQASMFSCTVVHSLRPGRGFRLLVGDGLRSKRNPRQHRPL